MEAVKEDKLTNVEVGYESSKYADDVDGGMRGTTVTKGFSTTIQGNLSPICKFANSGDENNTFAEEVEDVIEVISHINLGEKTLKGVIDRRDSEFGADYQGIKNEKFLAGDRHPGKRPRLQNIHSLSNCVAETLAMFHFCAGKKPGGTWTLTFPKRAGKLGTVRAFPSVRTSTHFGIVRRNKYRLHTILIQKY